MEIEMNALLDWGNYYYINILTWICCKKKMHIQKYKILFRKQEKQYYSMHVPYVYKYKWICRHILCVIGWVNGNKYEKNSTLYDFEFYMVCTYNTSMLYVLINISFLSTHHFIFFGCLSLFYCFGKIIITSLLYESWEIAKQIASLSDHLEQFNLDCDCTLAILMNLPTCIYAAERMLHWSISHKMRTAT